MAINRDAYKSLVESVQDTVSRQNLVEWPFTINGQVANNAYELSQILNGMTGKPDNAPGFSSASGVAGALKSKANLLASSKKGAGKTSKPSKPSKPSAKGVGASVDTAIAEANRPYIPSNLSGAALAQYLNDLQNQGGANVGTASGNAGRMNSNLLSSTRKGKTPKPSTPSKPSKPSVKGAGTSVGAASIAEEGDWDILDEILAEGLELYGEDGLEEILTSFAVSGEMSQELADLLNDE